MNDPLLYLGNRYYIRQNDVIDIVLVRSSFLEVFCKLYSDRKTLTMELKTPPSQIYEREFCEYFQSCYSCREAVVHG